MSEAVTLTPVQQTMLNELLMAISASLYLGEMTPAQASQVLELLLARLRSTDKNCTRKGGA